MALVPIVLLTSLFFVLVLCYVLFIKPNNKLLLIAIIFIIVFLAIIGLTFQALLIELDKVEAYGELGPFGDYIGGVLNPIISVFAVFAAGFAFYAQYEANKQVQEQFKIQQFESQFFEMLRLHKENINEMKISGYDILMSKSVETGNTKVIETNTRTQIERTTEGRKVFVSMNKEFKACYKFCELYNSKRSSKYSKNKILELAYRIFLFSSTSNLIFSNEIDSKFILEVKKELKLIRDIHKETSGQFNSFPGIGNKNIDLHIKYSPFTGHQSRLGHYYRHLFSTVKYVVKKEKEDLFSYKQSREYLKILRAQMSNDEQIMLYYNYIIGFGANWDYLGEEGNEFLTKYRMLHNLPVDNLKYVENPRKHFQRFIESINDDDPMFEWGDKQ